MNKSLSVDDQMDTLTVFIKSDFHWSLDAQGQIKRWRDRGIELQQKHGMIDLVRYCYYMADMWESSHVPGCREVHKVEGSCIVAARSRLAAEWYDQLMNHNRFYEILIWNQRAKDARKRGDIFALFFAKHQVLELKHCK